MPRTDVPAGHTSTSRSHGRIETRTLKVVTVPAGLGFPHAAQAIQLTRTSPAIATNRTASSTPLSLGAGALIGEPGGAAGPMVENFVLSELARQPAGSPP